MVRRWRRPRFEFAPEANCTKYEAVDVIQTSQSIPYANILLQRPAAARPPRPVGDALIRFIVAEAAEWLRSAHVSSPMPASVAAVADVAAVAAAVAAVAAVAADCPGMPLAPCPCRESIPAQDRDA